MPANDKKIKSSKLRLEREVERIFKSRGKLYNSMVADSLVQPSISSKGFAIFINTYLLLKNRKLKWRSLNSYSFNCLFSFPLSPFLPRAHILFAHRDGSTSSAVCPYVHERQPLKTFYFRNVSIYCEKGIYATTRNKITNQFKLMLASCALRSIFSVC